MVEVLLVMVKDKVVLVVMDLQEHLPQLVIQDLWNRVVIHGQHLEMQMLLIE